jgi:hypothetical protein
MNTDPIHAWHDFVKSRDPLMLQSFLHPDVVFESPIVHKPQQGRALATKYLTGALFVLGNPSFRYLEEWRSERSAILEFATDIDAIAINGIDMIHWDDQNLITGFKVMVRPLKAMTILHQKMGEYLMGLDSKSSSDGA